jgi:rhodanese-related sulfurtransferase
MKRLIPEALLVALAGVAIAFIANAVSPRGLSLSRDYFYQNQAAATVVPAGTNSAHDPNPAVAHHTELAARLQSKGMSLADSNQVITLFHDPRTEQGLVVFVDAREDATYQAGHIPGAYQLDYYHPDKFAPVVMPVCQSAQQIIVYCNGGNCTDSEMAATMLQGWGIPGPKLMVYEGGITEWTNNRLPIELGERKSGQIRP